MVLPPRASSHLEFWTSPGRPRRGDVLALLLTLLAVSKEHFTYGVDIQVKFSLGDLCEVENTVWMSAISTPSATNLLGC